MVKEGIYIMISSISLHDSMLKKTLLSVIAWLRRILSKDGWVRKVVKRFTVWMFANVLVAAIPLLIKWKIPALSLSLVSSDGTGLQQQQSAAISSEILFIAFAMCATVIGDLSWDLMERHSRTFHTTFCVVVSLWALGVILLSAIAYGMLAANPTISNDLKETAWITAAVAVGIGLITQIYIATQGGDYGRSSNS